MKRKFIVFGLLGFSSLYINAQRADTAFRSKKLTRSEIQVVYSHYMQNGNHSAVTGGTGTEKLTVYAPDITYSQQRDSLSRFSVNAGVDIISSASTDNIDFIVSSASRTDAHSYINIAYNRKQRNKPLNWGGRITGSLESDYLSGGWAFSVEHTNRDQSRKMGAEVEMFIDDLRWGRLSGENTLKLVYPAELRSKEWFTVYKRQSYNLNLHLQQTINKKTLVALYPAFSFQQGLLATPFHRVYFKDSSLRVENLPRQRWKFPLGIQLNRFLGDKYFLRSYYRFYADNWGVLSNTLEIGFPVVFNPFISITPSFRFYHQKAARHFKPYHEHDAAQQFYTSDYDLSRFSSYEPAVEARFNTGLNAWFNSAVLRYSYYKRSDGLKANSVSLLLLMSYYNKR